MQTHYSIRSGGQVENKECRVTENRETLGMEKQSKRRTSLSVHMFVWEG